jgi:hypothetical protein
VVLVEVSETISNKAIQLQDVATGAGRSVDLDRAPLEVHVDPRVLGCMGWMQDD